MNVQSDYIHVRTFERATFNGFCFLNYPTACPFTSQFPGWLNDCALSWSSKRFKYQTEGKSLDRILKWW